MKYLADQTEIVDKTVISKRSCDSIDRKHHRCTQCGDYFTWLGAPLSTRPFCGSCVGREMIQDFVQTQDEAIIQLDVAYSIEREFDRTMYLPNESDMVRHHVIRRSDNAVMAEGVTKRSNIPYVESVLGEQYYIRVQAYIPKVPEVAN